MRCEASSVLHRTIVRQGSQTHCDVFVGAGSPYANPFDNGLLPPMRAAEIFAAWLPHNHDLLRIIRSHLVGRIIGCDCEYESAACHANAIAAVANNPAICADDPVFVFGSNLASRHGRGAARFAADHRGAQRRIAEGRSGRSYAIPTKSAQLVPLTIEHVRSGVERFLEHAREEPDTQFDVTRIGCGLAGFVDDDIAPLFAAAPRNCRLPYRWQRLLDPSLPPRIIIAGSRTLPATAFPTTRVAGLLATTAAPVIVSGGARGGDQGGERFAVAHGLDFLRVPAEWERYGAAAGPIRNQHLAFLGSHLIAIWDGVSKGTKHMLATAKADQLRVRQILV